TISRKQRSSRRHPLMFKRFCTLFLFCLWTVSFLSSQTSTSGAVVGVVKDPTGAVVGGAEVTLVEQNTNSTQTTKTDASGRFFYPAVTPGDYSISFTAKGFRKTTVNNLKVEVAKSNTVDQTLELGSPTEVVEVAAASMTQLQTTDSSVGE